MHDAAGRKEHLASTAEVIDHEIRDGPTLRVALAVRRVKEELDLARVDQGELGVPGRI